jgi:hypothetical protein
MLRLLRRATSEVDPKRYVVTLRTDDGSCEIQSLDGVDWHKAPVPPRRHRCWPQTKAVTDWVNRVHRCACGAIRISPFLDDRDWMERNSRKGGA